MLFILPFAPSLIPIYDYYKILIYFTPVNTPTFYYAAMRVEEKILLNEVKNGNRKVFEVLFHDYYPFLTKFAEGFVFDRQIAEDIVQNLFLNFWENAKQITIDTSIKSYLYQSIRNRCLNHIRDLHVQDKHKLLYIEASLNSEDPLSWHEMGLTEKIHDAIESLPRQMKEIFKMKYLEGAKTRDISKVKGVSENTVKTQLQRAKEKLRQKLADSTSLHFFL